MEPRPYQAEAFDAARKANVVMVGATGVGKVRVYIIRSYSAVVNAHGPNPPVLMSLERHTGRRTMPLAVCTAVLLYKSVPGTAVVACEPEACCNERPGNESGRCCKAHQSTNMSI